MKLDTAVTEECVMDVFTIIAQEFIRAGDTNPLDTAARLTALVIDRVEQDLPARTQRLPDPSPN